MVNIQRGEVEVTGQDGTSYIVKLGTAAICKLEGVLNRPVLDLFRELEAGTIRLTTVREFVKASCTTQPNDEDASEIIDNVGVMPMIDAMTKSILRTFNAEKATNGNGSGAANPPKPARRGKGSTGSSDSKMSPH